MCLLAAALLLCAQASHAEPGSEPLVRFEFDTNEIGLVELGTGRAMLGAGARYEPSLNGHGVVPGDVEAVSIPLPASCRRDQGTVCLWIRPSREIRIGEPRVVIPVLDCPFLRVKLVEKRNQSWLDVRIPATGMLLAKGTLALSHLKAKWYHLALAWDAPLGRLEAYLNGAVQEPLRLRRANAWVHPKPAPWRLQLGGHGGEGNRSVSLAVDGLRLYPTFLSAKEVARTLEGTRVPALAGEGRTLYPEEPIDLSSYKLDIVFEDSFSGPLSVMREDELLQNNKRIHKPVGYNWAFEGNGRVWASKGKLHMDSNEPERGAHLVLWNTRIFPENFVLEFEMSPQNSRSGQAGILFAARALSGTDIFDLDLPYRAGKLNTYGALHYYHVAYWATANSRHSILRRTSTLRKNPGAQLLSCGTDRIGGETAAPYKVRLVKIGRRISLETRGARALSCSEDGTSYGAILRDGALGLRQMAHARLVSYDNFKVWAIKPRD